MLSKQPSTAGQHQSLDSNTCPAPKDDSWLVRMLFGHRFTVLLFFIIGTVFFGYHALQLRPEASFLRMIPTYNPYIKNYINHFDDLKGMGNNVRVVVETTDGDIYSKEYLEVLQKVADDLFYIPGVFRGGVISLWSPALRWSAVTEEGWEGGPLMPEGFTGIREDLNAFRENLSKSYDAMQYVAENSKSSMILLPLQDKNPETGKPIDYQIFSDRLEEIRSKYESETIKIHITGFAKIVGDLIDGASRVGLFFLIAFVILLLMLLYNSRCWRSTMMRGVSSTVAVAWQLGILSLLGYGMNPYSMLVPFLMFALGVSHGIQMFNSMAHEMIGGSDKLKAARTAYSKLYIPGLAALFTDCIGFALLFVIRIGVIQDIAVGASVGVAVVAISDLILLPVLMSFSGISKRSIEHIRRRETATKQPLWGAMAHLTQPKPALVAIVLAAIMFGWGVYARQDLKIGDLDAGAPELRADSRYNRDNAFLNENYSTSSDVFVVMLETNVGENSQYDVVLKADRLAHLLRQTEGVQGVYSYVDYVKAFNSGFNEGEPRWMVIPDDQRALDALVARAPSSLVDPEGDFSPIVVFLKDHKNETLEAVTAVVEKFSKENNTETDKFLMAAGNAGIEAATNIEVERAQVLMISLVFGVIFLTLLITFRSIKAAITIIVPLYITSILCEAAMAKMGIGIKVATLPVIAVGVGIGVDYGVYIYNKFIEYLCLTDNRTMAYFETLKTTGRAVTFTGITLAIGVGTWVFSPIKFQGDMGLLLVFMFLWNMVGALCLIPAMVCLIGEPKSKKLAWGH